MTEQIRLRIDSQLAEEADEVCREIGITPTAAVSMFFAQMVKLLSPYGRALTPAHATES